HERFEIFVIAGDAEGLVRRVVSQADQIIRALSERHNLASGVVTQHGSFTSTLFRRSEDRGRDLVGRRRHVHSQPGRQQRHEQNYDFFLHLECSVYYIIPSVVLHARRNQTMQRREFLTLLPTFPLIAGAAPAPLKIKRVEPYVLKIGPRRDIVCARVETADGIYGWGEGT